MDTFIILTFVVESMPRFSLYSVKWISWKSRLSRWRDGFSQPLGRCCWSSNAFVAVRGSLVISESVMSDEWPVNNSRFFRLTKSTQTLHLCSVWYHGVLLTLSGPSISLRLCIYVSNFNELSPLSGNNYLLFSSCSSNLSQVLMFATVVQ